MTHGDRSLDGGTTPPSAEGGGALFCVAADSFSSSHVTTDRRQAIRTDDVTWVLGTGYWVRLGASC